jgi:tetratricopeptide (TPR) repeat protein
MVVESLLLDLTRKMDQWSALCEVVVGPEEIYEGTGLTVDVATALEREEVDGAIADRVVPYVDGFRSLEQVSTDSDIDQLSVLQVASALFQAGAIRPVSAEDLLARGEDLLARGEALPALPLLRRAIDRGDAPPEARLRLADALEASGRRMQAALEIDHYAAQADESQPAVVFDALHRALTLRDGDAATAARLCDFYLRNRPWLRDRRSEALNTLRHLIHGAVTDRRPLEAARRLTEFIQNGDAPSEDLLVLADLYSAGGEPSEAGSALFRRAEDLLAAGRVAPARELLQRVIQLDPSRGDARNRLHVLRGEDRKRRQRRRYTVFFVLLGLLMLGAGAAWWTYNKEAGRAVRTVRVAAEEAVQTAEDKANILIETFRDLVALAADAEVADPALAEKAEMLVTNVRAAVQGTEGELYDFAAELERYTATDHKEANLVILRHLEARRRSAIARAEGAVHEAKRRGSEALTVGEAAHTAGEFEKARVALLTARNLAFDDSAQRARAELLLEHVERYRADFGRAMEKINRAREAGDVAATYRLGVQLLIAQLDSDLTHRVKLPVALTSDPAGASVRLGDEATGQVTPCVLEYSPFEETTLWMQLPGRMPRRFELPSFETITRDRQAALAWRPYLSADLPEGPQWSIPAAEGPFLALSHSGSVPILLTKDGRSLVTVDLEEGRPGARLRIDRAQGVRRIGTLRGGFEWRIVGQRTLLLRPPTGSPWEVQALGRLERAPATDKGVVILVDARGTAYGVDALSGREIWRRALASTPSQSPRSSALGFLITTVDGTAYAIQPESGEPKVLAAAVRGHALLLPLGSGALLLGGGPGGARIFDAEAKERVVGGAAPEAGFEPWVGDDGVAWIESDGVRWMGTEASAPVAVEGLGNRVVGVGGMDGHLYGVSADGVLRAASVADPSLELWRSALGPDRLLSPPLALGPTVFVLTEAGLVAIAR